MTTAMRVLLDHGVKEENILLLNVFATPKGEKRFLLMLFTLHAGCTIMYMDVI